MPTDEYGGIGVALVVGIGTLRAVLKTLHADGRRWWIASHPLDALEDRTVAVGFGDQGCTDVLNRAFFRIPVMGGSDGGNPDRLLLLFDASVITCDEVGYYLEKGRFVKDQVADFQEFFVPVKEALVKRLQEQLAVERRSDEPSTFL